MSSIKAVAITSEDVLRVAKSVKIELTTTEVQEVINRYPAEQEQDSAGTWNLVVENIAHQLAEERVKE